MIRINIIFGSKQTTTKKFTHNIPLLGMCSNVFIQVVASHEFFATFGALKSLFAGVCSTMPLQLIRSGEAFATMNPRAHEWPVPRVPSQMGSQMARLPINFIASGNMANVLTLSIGWPFTFRAIRACAGDTF